MLKFLKFFISVLLGISIFVLVSIINLNVFFSSPNTAKSFLADSGIYPLVSIGIRENLIKQDATANDKGTFLEIADAVLDENTIKVFVEDLIDQYFTAIENKDNNPTLVLHLSSLSSKVKDALSVKNKALISQMPDAPDRTIDLQQNSFFRFVSSLDKTLIYVIIAVAFFSIILLLGDSWSGKIGWLSFATIFSGILVGLQTLFYYFGLSETMIQNIIVRVGFEDQKFVLGVKKLIYLIVEYQKSYFIVATVIVFALGIILMVLAKLFKKAPAQTETLVAKQPLPVSK